jgi:hypothetical protein
MMRRTEDRHDFGQVSFRLTADWVESAISHSSTMHRIKACFTILGLIVSIATE